MNNLIQTFDKFNEGRKRPNRRDHLRMCGFDFKSTYLIEPPFTASTLAERIAKVFNELNGKPCHIVYWRGKRNMDGQQGYQYWIKEL